MDMSMIMLAIFTLGCGFCAIRDYFRRRNMFNNAERYIDYYDAVEAEVVNYEVHRGGNDGSDSYYPIYVYMYNGESHQYRSLYDEGSEQYPIGSTKTLYIDKRTKKVIEKPGIRMLICGIGLIAASLAFLYWNRQ